MIRKRLNQKEISTPQAEGWEKTKMTLGNYTKKTYCKPSEQLFPNRRPLSYPNLTQNMKMYIRFKQHKKLIVSVNFILNITISFSMRNILFKLR